MKFVTVTLICTCLRSFFADLNLYNKYFEEIYLKSMDSSIRRSVPYKEMSMCLCKRWSYLRKLSLPYIHIKIKSKKNKYKRSKSVLLEAYVIFLGRDTYQRTTFCLFNTCKYLDLNCSCLKIKF